MTKKFLKGFILITFSVLIIVFLVDAAQYYRVNNGTNIIINEWGVCKTVTNNTGKDIFVPTNTSNEWNQFRTYYPSGVSLGNSITFTYKGSQVTYGIVSHNNECWMDRNLGASRVATAYNDSSAYGDLFQWGRLDDGHQNRTSLTTTALSSSDNPGHNKFILAPNSPYDWRSPQNNNLWQGVNGINNPCPSGWRIPTYDEWNTEIASWSPQNYSGAFASPLKLTLAGFRGNGGGAVGDGGNKGFYWASNVSSIYAWGLGIYLDGASMYASHPRANGMTVRCIKN